MVTITSSFNDYLVHQANIFESRLKAKPFTLSVFTDKSITTNVKSSLSTSLIKPVYNLPCSLLLQAPPFDGDHRENGDRYLKVLSKGSALIIHNPALFRQYLSCCCNEQLVVNSSLKKKHVFCAFERQQLQQSLH